MGASSSRSGINIKQALEQWARWRIYRASGELGYPRRTILGKMLDGLPSTVCTLCQGRKQVPGHKVGVNAHFVPCPQCGATGRIKADPGGVKVNPAFIRPTGTPGVYNDDPQSQHVDWLVCSRLTEYQRSILLIEYTHNGTQEMKAAKEGVSRGYYLTTLSEAVSEIEAGLVEWARWPDAKRPTKNP